MDGWLMMMMQAAIAHQDDSCVLYYVMSCGVGWLALMQWMTLTRCVASEEGEERNRFTFLLLFLLQLLAAVNASSRRDVNRVIVAPPQLIYRQEVVVVVVTVDRDRAGTG